jgi:hypothetical protein
VGAPVWLLGHQRFTVSALKGPPDLSREGLSWQQHSISIECPGDLSTGSHLQASSGMVTTMPLNLEGALVVRSLEHMSRVTMSIRTVSIICRQHSNFSRQKRKRSMTNELV